MPIPAPGVFSPQPRRDLLRAPLQLEFVLHQSAQNMVAAKDAAPLSASLLARPRVRQTGVIQALPQRKPGRDGEAVRHDAIASIRVTPSKLGTTIARMTNRDFEGRSAGLPRQVDGVV
jgi:hypothetical protein